MTTYTLMYQEILARVSEMQREALTTLVGTQIDSVPYFPYGGQEAFPYWTNRLGTANYTQDETGMDNLHIDRQIIMRLLVGNVTEGYEGELQERLNEFIGDFVPYINRQGNAMLQTTTYPVPMQYLEQPLRLVSDSGVVVVQFGGAGKLQLGIEFVIELNLTIRV